MAILLASASTEYLNLDNLPIANYPFTMACWFRHTTALTNGCLMSLADSSVADIRYEMLVTNGGAVRGQRQNTGSNESADTSTTILAQVWAHAAVVFLNATSCTAYLNGGGAIANTNSVTYGLGSNQRTRLGNSASSSATLFNGAMAVPALWNVALDVGEIGALAKGFDPRLIRPASLRFLLRGRRTDLVGTTQRDCWKNGFDFTEVNTPTYADDPPLILAA